jgi:hypothetical protein
MEEERRAKGKGKGKVQVKIDGMVEIEHKQGSKQFTRDGALEAIAKFVACDDQVKELSVEASMNN